MKLQALLKKYSNQLTGLSALLILIAYSGKYLLNSYFLWAFALLLATFIGLVPIAFQAVQALKFKQVSIELLVSIAVIAALFIQEYEESAIVTFLFAFGAFLEKKTLEKTRSSIKSLTEITPSTALRISGEVIDIDDVKINDELLVKTGAQIPVDGSIYEGAGFVNESSISGESAEIKKGVGDKVFAGTLLENGSLLIQAEKVGEDTTFGKIIELVEEAQDTKSSAEKFIDRFAKYYTPISQSGKEQLLRIIEAGDYEGEGALLGVTNGQLYGQAMIDSTICFLRQSDFETLLTTYPSLSLQLLKLNAKKYLAAEHQAGFLALDDVEARLAHYFLNISATSDSIYFEIPMKLKELANYIGTSPETISRKIKVFEENKIISRQGRMIKLLDKEKLEDDFA